MLPQGSMNWVADMMIAMNKVLGDCNLEIMMPFLDEIPMKGCAVEEKDETTDDWGCRKFVVDDIRNCEKVLLKLENVHLTLSEECRDSDRRSTKDMQKYTSRKQKNNKIERECTHNTQYFMWKPSTRENHGQQRITIIEMYRRTNYNTLY